MIIATIYLSIYSNIAEEDMKNLRKLAEQKEKSTSS